MRVIFYPLNIIMVLTIKAYRIVGSEIYGNGCIFLPTCSAYAIAAYKEYNFFYASVLMMRRLMRCNSKNAGGYDHLPINMKGEYRWVC